MAKADMRTKAAIRQGDFADRAGEEQIRKKDKPPRKQARVVTSKKPMQKEEKRRRGRPKKHENGGQISIWFEEKTRAALMQYVALWRCSISDAVNRLLLQAMK